MDRYRELTRSNAIEWHDYPGGPKAAYTVVFSRHSPPLDTSNGTPEVAVRSYALLDHIAQSGDTGVAKDIRWDLIDFAAWFARDEAPSAPASSGGLPASPLHAYTITAAIFAGQVPGLFAACGGDLQRVVRDGSLGDPVSFFPLIESPRADRTYAFRYSGGRIDLTTTLAADDTAVVAFPRFGTYEPGGCQSLPLKAVLRVACLPYFVGWHGLDVELFPRQATVSGPFRRAEGSLGLDFQPDVAQDQPPTARVRIGARKPAGCEGAAPRDPFFKITALRLPVGAAVPYTRDLLPPDLLSSIDEDELSDFDESPILIPLLPVDPDPPKPLLLEINEACEPPRVRNLRLELMRQPSDRSTFMAARGFLVLDRTPFLVAKVELPALARNDGVNSSVVARRVIDLESGQPSWNSPWTRRRPTSRSTSRCPRRPRARRRFCTKRTRATTPLPIHTRRSSPTASVRLHGWTSLRPTTRNATPRCRGTCAGSSATPASATRARRSSGWSLNSSTA